jgi:hypothetical protein
MLWCYDDQIIVQQGLGIYHEGTADTLRSNQMYEGYSYVV